MFSPILDHMLLMAAYTRANLRAQLEYRGAFFSQVAAMFINDGAWLLFWMFFFTRFPVLQGWNLIDVLSMWALVAAGFGIAYAVMGNALQLAPVVVQGELDMWMLHPRPLLPHLLLGRSHPSAWGDVIFGYAVYFLFVRPDVSRMVVFVCLTFVVALAFVGLGVLAGSLSFYIGNTSAFADEWRNAVTTFALYPPTLFEGLVKLILFTLIPAGFVSYVPVEAVRSLSMMHALASLGGSLALAGIAAAVFYRGLRRYESGNLVSINS